MKKLRVVTSFFRRNIGGIFVWSHRDFWVLGADTLWWERLSEITHKGRLGILL